VRIVTRTLALALLLVPLGAASTGAKSAAIHGLRYGAHGNVLTAYDPVTLQPSRPPIQLGRFAQAWSISLDRTRFVAAVGTRRPGEEAALRFVDLERGAVSATLTIEGERRRIAATAWVRGRVLAVATGGSTTTVYSVDPQAPAVVGKVELDGVLVSGVRTSSSFVLLLAPEDAIGPAVVASVDQSPRARTVALERVTVGTVFADGRTTVRRPGLTASPSERSLYVFGGVDEPAAAVDLRTLAVRYRPVRRTAAPQKQARGSVRAAATLPDGRVVVWGHDYASSKPVAISLVRPRDWSSRLLHRAGWVDVAGGLIFTRGANGVGLRVQHPDGPPVELFRTGSPSSVDVVGPRALVRFFGRGVSAAVVQLGSGRIVGRRVPANLLLERGQIVAG
jgi:hypothetical protein